jgi:hypothetical protein
MRQNDHATERREEPEGEMTTVRQEDNNTREHCERTMQECKKTQKDDERTMMRDDNNVRITMRENAARGGECQNTMFAVSSCVWVLVFMFVGHDDIDCLIVPWQRCTGVSKMAMSW